MSFCRPIFLLEVSTDASTPADLLDRITEANLNDWHREWRPAMTGVVKKCAQQERIQLHSHRQPTGIGSKR